MAVLVLATACRQEDDDAAASGSTSDATDATLSATAASSDAPADSGPGDDASTGEPPDDTGSDTDGGGEVEHGDPFVLWDGGGGATREYFNAEAALAWRHWLGILVGSAAGGSFTEGGRTCVRCCTWARSWQRDGTL